MSGSKNSDNIVELLHYCCLECDTNKKHHLESAEQNARYVSQNEHIDWCAVWLLQKKLQCLLKKVGIILFLQMSKLCNERTNESNAKIC